MKAFFTLILNEVHGIGKEQDGLSWIKRKMAGKCPVPPVAG
jgi:hypothetical protein